ncbi:SusC/RagA family TonB-linked outer membrane protein [Chitinophaga sp.]|uniref:SusC/RagA family TonB-linked outer membrane protein n=1 Tax=Chitinophaga sp. TaxID=1869181 RepID=UPI0031D59509
MNRIFAANGAGCVVLCLLFVLRASVPAFAQTPGPSDVDEMLNKRMDLSVPNKSLKAIFKLISSTTGLHFIASTNQLDVTDHYSIYVKDFSVTQILIELLGRQGFTWTSRGNMVVFSRSGPLIPLPPNSIAKKMSSKLNTVTGIVMDEKGTVLPGATVRISGTNVGGTTDETGRFNLLTEKEDLILYTTYTGYRPLEMSANVDDSVRIKLVLANNVLDETVIMAYGSTTRRTNTGSIGKVSSSEISRQPVVNLLGALEARIPGLVVAPSSGVNGTSFTVQIRGRNSFANGSDPLYIIDGVPYISSKAINLLGSIAVQNFDAGGISPFNNLNKEDIESIEILKDADATAIYGSRGANGVILITTKRGKEGKPTLQLKLGRWMGKVPGMGNLLSKDQYMAMRKEAFANDGITPDNQEGSAGYAPDLLLWNQNRSQDWQKMIIGGTANLTNLNLALSGGSKVFQYRLSGSLLKGTSVFPVDMPYWRGTADVSLTYLSKNKRLSADVSGKYGKDRNEMFNGTLLGTVAPPNAPGPKDENGKLVWEENGAEFSNPFADLYKKYTIKTGNVLGSMKLGYRIVDSLRFLLSTGINRYRDNENSQVPTFSMNPNTDSASTGSARFGMQEIKSYIIEPQLDYVRTFGFGKLNALVGATWQYSSNRNMAINGSGYTDDGRLDDISAAATTSILSNYSSKYKYAALFGRLIYNYKNRYILNFSARRDGSSRFGPGKRWSNFGSIGGAWLFGNEDFVKNNVGFLDYGKLRGSYGITGNDQIGDYRYLDTWSSNINANPYQGIIPLTPDALLNSNFSWERSKKMETAIELGFLDNKLITTIAYFQNTNDRQIIAYRLPAQTGFMNVIKNEGVVVKNWGWEFEMTADVLRTPHFNWRLNANITVPQNRLIAFPDLENYDYSLHYSIGYPLNVLKLYHNAGVDKANGLYKFEDVNKDGTLSYYDYQNVGDLDPKFYGGIGNTFQWKGLRLDIFLTLRKQTVPDYFYAAFVNYMSPGMLGNQSRFVLDRWQHAGDETKVQRYVTSNGGVQNYNIWYSDAVYENNFYLKVKNISLTYSLNADLVKKMKLSGLRCYLQGQNLFTLTHYKGLDPETPYYFSLPTLRIVTVGFDVTL